MLTKLKLGAGGVKSYLPFLASYRGTGGSTSARYCYSVWMRHFKLIRDSGFDNRLESVVELGPGDSIGVGIAALLTGSERYLALDVVPHADTRTNLAVFEELVELFQQQAAIPGSQEFPGVHPRLPDYGFPVRHLSPERLRQFLKPERLARLRACLENPGEAPPLIRYICPWYEASLAEPATVDVILSQVALQDIDNLDHAYRIMTRWLKPGGIMSHQIDFSFPGSEAYWNEHWGYSDFFWEVVRGRRPYYFNRAPLSQYLELAQRHGHSVRQILTVEGRGLPPSRLNPRFRQFPDRDFSSASAYILTARNETPD